MSKAEKLLEKAQRSPQSLKYREFESLLETLGWTIAVTVCGFLQTERIVCQRNLMAVAWQKITKYGSFCDI